jgi:flagellar basal body-associated protein FliL
MAILCVGVAYFVLAVVLPIALFASGQQPWPAVNTNGLVFSGLAGVAGAVGAICVVFASSAAVKQAAADGVNPATYRIYIAPLIFGLAPVINTLMSSVWHPKPGDPWHFEVELPGWKLWVGIILVGAGAALVLFSKEEAESTKHATAKPQPPAVAVTTPAINPNVQESRP